MDHDDLCHPERLARQIAFLEEHPEVDLLATQCLTMDEQERLIGVLPSAISHAEICSRPWQGFYMAHPSWMGRTEWFRRNAYQDPAPYCCEDQELLLRAHYHSCYHTLPERLLAYRVRSHTKWSKQFRTRVATGKMKIKHFTDQGQWINAMLSFTMELIRVGFDGVHALRRMSPSAVKVDGESIAALEEYQQWTRLIATLNDSIESSSGSEGKPVS